MIPDTVRFVIVIALLAAAVYAGAWGLASFPPEQFDIIRPLPHEKLRQE